jgi:transcriptional regulator with XRE-family HTH domain
MSRSAHAARPCQQRTEPPPEAPSNTATRSGSAAIPERIQYTPQAHTETTGEPVSAAEAEPADQKAGPAAKHEGALARSIRAEGLVTGLTPAQIAAEIHDRCEPVAGTTWIRAYRLAHGISLADVVAQVRAWYASEGRPPPRFSETLLSAYESGHKRPGPQYLHYLCAVYRAEPADLGYPGECFCGHAHREDRLSRKPGAAFWRCGGTGSSVYALPNGDPAYSGASGPVPRQAPGGTDAARPDGAAPGSTAPGSTAPGGASPGGAVPGGGDAPGVPGAPLGNVIDLASTRQHLPHWGPWSSDAPAAPGGQRSCEAEDDDDVLRRAMLRMIADAAAPVDGPFLGAVDRIRRRMDEALVGGSVSATMLDQWEEMAAGYARQYVALPPLRLLCDVLLDFGDVRRMCERRQPLEFSQRLCRLASQLAGLAGMILIDVGDQRMARSFFRTARAAADETGDRHLRAWVAVREAFVPLYYGDASEACTLARAGAGLAGRNPCVAGVMAPVLEARSLARIAARRESAGKRQALRRVNSLLGHAQEALTRLPASELADPAFGYTERQFLFHEGDTLVTLGAHQGADRAFTRALSLYTRDEILDRSLVTLGLARCRLEEDEPEEALRLSREMLLGVPREHRSEIMVRAARSLGDSVACKHGEVRAIREYREALVEA